MKLRNICAVVLVAGIALVTSWNNTIFASKPPHRIERITWFIHPYCWSMTGDEAPNGVDAKKWKACLTWERNNHQKYMQMISRMGAKEAVIIYPIGNSEPMQELMAHARFRLGDQCVIIKRTSVDPEFMNGVQDPIRQFLDDSPLPGRAEWIEAMITSQGKHAARDGLAAELDRELRVACRTIGYDWRPESLEVLYYSRLVAYEIENTFRERNITYEPNLKCVAVGEGFEQCAMTWKGMLPGYLGLSSPIENEARLSVTGQPEVVFGEFKERINLGDEIRLFLWRGAEGESIGLFTRASFCWSDPQQYATVSLKELDLEVSEVRVNQIRGRRANQISTIVLGPRFDPSPAFQPDPDHLRVPIFAGSRRGGDHAYYIVAPAVDPEVFRENLIDAQVSP